MKLIPQQYKNISNANYYSITVNIYKFWTSNDQNHLITRRFGFLYSNTSTIWMPGKMMWILNASHFNQKKNIQNLDKFFQILSVFKLLKHDGCQNKMSFNYRMGNGMAVEFKNLTNLDHFIYTKKHCLSFLYIKPSRVVVPFKI
jgi:hypothetical protein